MFVCFVSFAGIFIVFHAFTNMDDLAQYAEHSGGMAIAMLRYYGPYTFMLFEMTGTIVTLLALLFTIGLLRRSGELTAMLAAGVSHGRIVRPMLIAAAVMMGLAAANREWMLPQWQDQLGLKVRDLDEEGGGERPMLPVYDRVAGVLLNGKALRLMQQEIVSPNFKLHANTPTFGQQLGAEVAVWYPAQEGRVSGYLLRGVKSPKNVDQLDSIELPGGTVLRTSKDTAGLASGECFVGSQVPIDFLQTGTSWMRMAKTSELARRVSNPAVYCASDVRVTLHDRPLRPFIDFSLIVLSLSLIVGRSERNLFVVTGYASLLVAFFFVLRTVAHMMGGSGYLLDPATAAWVPLIILAPLAYSRYRVIAVS